MANPTAGELGPFRRLYSADWYQREIKEFDDGEKVVWLYALTGPESTSLGLFRISAALASETLGNVSPAEFDQRLGVVCRALGWEFDPVVRVLWIPTWIPKNRAQSPNVVKSWRRFLNRVPDCPVKERAVTALHRYLENLPEDFQKAFGRDPENLPDAFREPSEKLPDAVPKVSESKNLSEEIPKSFREPSERPTENLSDAVRIHRSTGALEHGSTGSREQGNTPPPAASTTAATRVTSYDRKTGKKSGKKWELHVAKFEDGRQAATFSPKIGADLERAFKAKLPVTPTIVPNVRKPGTFEIINLSVNTPVDTVDPALTGINPALLAHAREAINLNSVTTAIDILEDSFCELARRDGTPPTKAVATMVLNAVLKERRDQP